MDIVEPPLHRHGVQPRGVGFGIDSDDCVTGTAISEPRGWIVRSAKLTSAPHSPYDAASTSSITQIRYIACTFVKICQLGPSPRGSHV
jgi:hypothetical protein